jgi:hypothetical protein
MFCVNDFSIDEFSANAMWKAPSDEQAIAAQGALRHPAWLGPDRKVLPYRQYRPFASPCLVTGATPTVQASSGVFALRLSPSDTFWDFFVTDQRPPDDDATRAADRPDTQASAAPVRTAEMERPAADVALLPASYMRILRWGSLAIASVILAVAALTLYGGFFLRPDCDSSRVKKYFSTLFNIDASAFDKITTASKTDDAYDCIAHLLLKDGRKLQVNYRITGVGRDAKAQITGTVFEK